MICFSQLGNSQLITDPAAVFVFLAMTGMALWTTGPRLGQPGRSYGRAGWGTTPWGAILLAAIALLAAGCAAPDSKLQTARPGAGLKEYQQVLLDLRKVVTASRQSVEQLSAATPNHIRSAGARFDESLHRLEVVSLKARARADAIEKRGAAYFEEWAEEISNSADGSSRRTAQERFAELRQHFDGILEDSQRMRQAFRRFLEGARALRVPLGQNPIPADIENARPELSRVAADGYLAEEAINQLLKKLNATEAAVVSRPLPPAQPGG